MAKKKRRGGRAKTGEERKGVVEEDFITSPHDDLNDGADLPPNEGARERPPWKRIGIAVGSAIGINAAILPVVFIPIFGVIIILMLAPYAAAVVGGRWLRREHRSEWVGASIYVELIWPSILTLIVISLIGTLGTYDIEFDLFGTFIIGMIYVFPLIFTLIGFYQGSEPPEVVPPKVDLVDGTDGPEGASEE